MTKAIIFDLDGVLVPTDHLHYLAWKKVAEARNFAISYRFYDRHLRGVGRDACSQALLTAIGIPLQESKIFSLSAEKNELFLSLLSKFPPQPFKNIRGLILNLRALGFRIGIGSSSQNAKLVSQRAGLLDIVDVLVDSVGRFPKPHPEIFVTTAKLLKVKPENCLVVEDSLSGICAANQAGMKVIGILKESPRVHCDHVLADINSLTLNLISRFTLA